MRKRLFWYDQSMNKYKAVLLDVDGVLVLPPRMFSEIYCEKYGKDLSQLTPFYDSREFQNALIGKMDLKDAITAHQDKWQWDGDLDQLINEWLEGENYPNNELLKVVDELRAADVKVYIVTAQEKYRATFLREKVFKDKYDGFIVSCDLGLAKHTSEFWQEVISRVGEDPSSVAYFDDKQSLVELAHSFGIDTHVYTDVDNVRQIVE